MQTFLEDWWKNLLGFQNLFLYGYGAVFNFLGMLGTVIIKGTYSLGFYSDHFTLLLFLIMLIIHRKPLFPCDYVFQVHVQ